MARKTLRQENEELRALYAEAVREAQAAHARIALLEERRATNARNTPPEPQANERHGSIAKRLAVLLKSTVRFNDNRFEYFEPSDHAWHPVPANKVAFVVN